MWSAGYCWFFYGLKDGGILAGVEVDVLEGVDVASSVSIVLVTVTVLVTNGAGDCGSGFASGDGRGFRR